MVDAVDSKSTLGNKVLVRVRSSADKQDRTKLIFGFLDPTNPVNRYLEMERPLFIPVILGTARQGRRSEHAARLALKAVRCACG